MKRGFAITDVVFAHRVDHQIKELARLDQRVHKRLRVLRVDVVIISPMNEQEPPVQVLRTPTSSELAAAAEQERRGLTTRSRPTRRKRRAAKRGR